MALGRKTGGRQKGSLNLSTREMREMAQGMAKDVLDTLKNILDDATQPGEVRIKAGKEILDRLARRGSPAFRPSALTTSPRCQTSSFASAMRY